MHKCLPSIGKAVERIRSGDVQPADLVEQCLRSIERFDDQVQAWVLADKEFALREAERLGEMAARGQLAGPLHGIPIGIKDIIDVAGLPTEAGSPLRQGYVAEKDAPVVAKLRQAGAVILGKRGTTPYACFDPAPTRNPWNLSHTPGGSSSGSAAAVAMNMCMAAIGSQTGGSITRPASYCGVCGMKPTVHAVSTEGVVPVSRHLDHVGPIARHVDDLRTLFRVLSDPIEQSIRTLTAAPGESGLAIELLTKSTQELSLYDDLRKSKACPPIRLIEGYFEEEADEHIAEATRAATARLQDRWTSETHPRLPDSFDDVHTMHRRIMAVDAATNHQDEFKKHPDAFPGGVASLIEEGFLLTAVEYAEALNHQQQFRRDVQSLFELGGILVTPATNTTAPEDLTTTGDPKFNSPWSYAGLPTVSIPCGLASNGMPTAIQLIGPHGMDEDVLDAALWCEQQIGFSDLPPMLCGFA